ncbi:hippurate hydrolase [Roseovarius halotolerans]|uniref:Putative hydrolase YxeP n=1 Tax=Roseovarius halotolerans TaxID=505353 RepID=A0A1X6Z850_9RHOB|nr:M20 aminoacylase family protein [Roseovarius halotolerans]RKT30366.1 hippurate hydrolase [Roseovarius halotolerans]SLN43471.1 putative hydrolase YxeP [Roseovarius halotolerans]
MAVINRIAGFAEEMAGWRRHLHAHPELGLECHETAAYLVARLREFGITEIEEGIAQSGVVALIEGQGEGPTIGLRADVDALPIAETTGAPHASTVPGRMHACGHDGHSAMLLGAAKYLAETRNFTGRVALIFQPAEEGPGGAQPMVDAGIMDRYGITQVYALHTAPGVPEGTFHTTPGPIMASVDTVHIDITGQGGHGAMPHDARDPVVAACGMVQAIQTIVSRNNYALDDLVISITQIHTGSADNVIPGTAYVNGTVRTFDKEVRAMVRRRLEEIVAGQAASYGVDAVLRYEEGYPPTVNDPEKTAFAARVAATVAGEEAVFANGDRLMGSEDFAAMLEARPGAFLFLGQGEGPGLHQPGFDFNDAVAPVGASFFARLVEEAQPAG